MKIEKILVVCDGNICRSPLAATLLREQCQEEVEVRSAGLVALKDHDIDETVRAVAKSKGIDCPSHRGTVLDRDLCRWADVILVMEQRQRDEIGSKYPEALGKAFLIGHWVDSKEVPDPYQKNRAMHEVVFDMLDRSCRSWSQRINRLD